MASSEPLFCLDKAPMGENVEMLLEWMKHVVRWWDLLTLPTSNTYMYVQSEQMCRSAQGGIYSIGSIWPTRLNVARDGQFKEVITTKRRDENRDDIWS